MKFFAKTMITQFLYERQSDPYLKISQTQRKERAKYSNFIWITGFQFRYSDTSWPNYHNGFKRKKWNKRNDSIYVPYGSLPRGEYQYLFAIYDSLWSDDLTKELVRLKNKWPEEHAILDGEFIDYQRENNLYFKKTQKINSAIIQLYLRPVVKNPLPGKIIIALNHLDRHMDSPVCAYWQTIEDYHTEDVPTDGYWSNYGMKVSETNKSMTICLASHYGTFALLMEPIMPPVTEPISTLDVLTIILALVSIIMLIVYVIAMAMLECYQTVHCRIYIYIAVSMAFSHLFFLIGFFTRKDFGNCTSITTLMELASMFVVTWFMIDGMHQLSQIRPLFNPKTNANAFYIIVGVGLPIAVLIAMLEFPYPAFEELAYCWPNVDGLDHLYFIGPIAAVIAVVAFLRVMAFGKVRKDEKKMMNDINYIRAFNGIQSTTVILTTCILYWVVGTIGIKQSGNVIQAVQLILPIIQIIISGQIIYYFFRKNDEVTDALEEQKKILERLRMNKMDHLAGVCMDVTYIPNATDKDENLRRESADIKTVDNTYNGFDNSSMVPSSSELLQMEQFTSETNLIK